jgi:hypothetical protein
MSMLTSLISLRLRCASADRQQSLVDDDLKFHRGLMGSVVQFGNIEQSHVGDDHRAA